MIPTNDALSAADMLCLLGSTLAGQSADALGVAVSKVR